MAFLGHVDCNKGIAFSKEEDRCCEFGGSSFTWIFFLIPMSFDLFFVCIAICIL
jgi:hypothetical protein